MQLTPDSRNERNQFADTATNLMMSSLQGSVESRSPKLKRNFSSTIGLHNRLNRAQNSSMSSLN